MFWKIYFVLSTLLIAWGLVTKPPSDAVEFSLEAVWIVQQVAVFGYAFEREILRADLWKGLFAVFVAALIASAALGASRLIEQGYNPAVALALSMVVMLFLAPSYVASFRYAFRRGRPRGAEPASLGEVAMRWAAALLAGTGVYVVVFSLFGLMWKTVGGDAASATLSPGRWQAEH